MTDRLDLPIRYRNKLEALLREHVPDVEVWAYGSRVNGQSHEGSDLDLALRSPTLEPLGGEYLDLIDGLEQSTIPILVQVHDWARLPKSFHREIEREYVVLVARDQASDAGQKSPVSMRISSPTSKTSDMAGEWTEMLLGELTDNFDAVRVPVKRVDRRAGPYPYYGASGVVDHVDDYLFDGEYLLIAEDGENLRTRNTSIAFLVNGKFWVNNHAHIVRGNHKANTRFLMYALSELDINGYLTGSTMPKLTQGNMNRISFRTPPLPEQRAIAHILGTLDDKIELNRRMNETLEAMARALFKSWFVDYDPVRAKIEGRWQRGESLLGLPAHLYDVFPDRLVDSEEGEVPDGWELKALAECFNLTMGQSPPGSTYNDYGEGLPFFQGRTDFGFRYPENRKFCTAPTRVAQPEDTLVSVRAPVGDINMAWEQCCVGRGIAALRHKSGSSSFTYYATWTIQPMLQEYEHTGTVFGAINKTQFESLRMVEPGRGVVSAFDSYVRPLDKRILSNERETLALVAQRDALLPRLVSGEIRVL